MTRVEKIMELAKGFSERTNCFRIAVRRVEKGLVYAYRDRRAKKRDFRSSWITTVNIASREHGVRYGELVPALSSNDILLNRKMLAELAQTEPFAFKSIIDFAKPVVAETKAVIAAGWAEKRAEKAAALAASSSGAATKQLVPNIVKRTELKAKLLQMAFEKENAAHMKAVQKSA